MLEREREVYILAGARTAVGVLPNTAPESPCA
jgi:hypothetical protein